MFPPLRRWHNYEILAAYFDISSIKALENKNQMIIENNPGLIFILDKDLKIIRANKTG